VVNAEKLKADEKVTMFIDYNHLINFRFETPNFVELIVNEYNRFEPYLRRGITQFMSDLGHQYAKDRFF
jgi:hypothetical protein